MRTALATVGGKTETILVNSQGLPLYYYLNDTAAKSQVTGGLAALWPPLTSASPAATGLTGKLAAVSDTHGRPGRLQRSPAVHLRRRSRRPGDRPGSTGLFRGHPGPHADRWVLDSRVLDSRVLDNGGPGPGRILRQRFGY